MRLPARADLLAYVPLAVATTAASVGGRERTHLATKLLLAPTLAAGVVTTREERPSARSATLVAALAGSVVGDWFMNASGRAGSQEGRRQSMRRGAAAFAVQQAGLVRLLLADGVRPRAVPATVVGGTLAGLAVVDTGGAGRPDPVLTAYGLLLGSMSALALTQRRTVAVGGGLFLLSDATIVLGEHLAKTPRQRAVGSGIVMSTYAAALALLVHGLRDEPAHPDPVPEDSTA
ncbi:lysoplasmalogenase family protein [Knoellia sp. CPCC 206450]|uniref:lysoplasmalogenase family protein n=1 Tax=Knoellia tibetensis TaxID=3404798 RepID=UPI003B43CC82